jgi:hypothetical protein
LGPASYTFAMYATQSYTPLAGKPFYPLPLSPWLCLCYKRLMDLSRLCVRNLQLGRVNNGSTSCRLHSRHGRRYYLLVQFIYRRTRNFLISPFFVKTMHIINLRRHFLSAFLICIHINILMGFGWKAWFTLSLFGESVWDVLAWVFGRFT